MYSRCIDLLMKSSRTEIKEVLGYCKNDFSLEEMISALQQNIVRTWRPSFN